MAEVMKLPADEPPGGANQPSAASNNSFHELNSLKTLLGKTWSELSNVMTRYHAQIVEKHQELEVTSLCADATRISQMDSDLKMLRTENGRLVTQILDSKSENTKLRTENRKLKDEVTMKDTLIEKIQNQMTQEALDYQAELASLKEILEARSRGAEVTAPLITSPDAQPAKRRKVSQQSPAPPKGATVQSPGAGVSSRGTTVTPVRSDVTTARSDVTPARNLPSTSSESPLRNDSVRKLSSSKASDFVQSGTEDNTSHSGRGFVKLDEVTDESNLDELEGILSEQESELLTEGQAEVIDLGEDLYDMIDLSELRPNGSVPFTESIKLPPNVCVPLSEGISLTYSLKAVTKSQAQHTSTTTPTQASNNGAIILDTNGNFEESHVVQPTTAITPQMTKNLDATIKNAIGAVEKLPARRANAKTPPTMDATIATTTTTTPVTSKKRDCLKSADMERIRDELSPYMRQSLESGTISLHWLNFIKEVANAITRLGLVVNSKGAYAAIGEYFTTTYPCVRRVSYNKKKQLESEWKVFTNALSTRIRKKRYQHQRTGCDS